MDPPREPKRLGVNFLPVMFAGVLALLYAVGAFLKTSELHGAGISVRDALPLVPIPQLLARGIGATTSAFPFWLLLVLTSAILYAEAHFLESRSDRRMEDLEQRFARSDQLVDEHERLKEAMESGDLMARVRARAILKEWGQMIDDIKPSRARFIGAFALAAAYVLVGYAILPPIMMSALTVGSVLGTSTRGRFSRPVRILLMWSVVGIAFLINTFAEPQPLAPVTLHQASGAELRGELITSTGDTWYITGAGHSIVAIRANSVVRAQVDNQRQRRWKSGFELIGFRRIPRASWLKWLS
jgi:hypothetical protein